jgi:hypothetical protein
MVSRHDCHAQSPLTRSIRRCDWRSPSSGRRSTRRHLRGAALAEGPHLIPGVNCSQLGIVARLGHRGLHLFRIAGPCIIAAATDASSNKADQDAFEQYHAIISFH